jgi:septum formation protein
MRLTLASQSPRRRQLVQLLGYAVDLCVADVDENSVMEPDPARNAAATAVLKAEYIASHHPERELILAADTIVALEGRMLGKPVDAAEAEQMLIALCGRQHQVHTGIALFKRGTGQMLTRVNTAVVTMRPYSRAEIANYVASGDPLDKAGAYAIQHPTFQPVADLDGCYTAVVGLSVCEVIRLLAEVGLPRRADLTAVRAAHQQYRCPIYPTLLDQMPELC